MKNIRHKILLLFFFVNNIVNIFCLQLIKHLRCLGLETKNALKKQEKKYKFLENKSKFSYFFFVNSKSKVSISKVNKINL